MMSDHVVVVGSGLAGYGVLRELRKLSPDARLTLVTLDEGHFYSKPALSTAFAKGKTSDTLVTTSAEKMAAQLRFDLRGRCAAETIDRGSKMLLTSGGAIAYDKLILALGAEPVRPQIGGNAAQQAFAVNNLDQYRTFREAVPGKRHRAPAHQDQASMDQRPGREDEPNDQGGHRQTLPLR